MSPVGVVRWGILGTGKIARIIATALADTETGELVAVGSRDAERAKQLCSEFGAARSGDYAAVVSDETVDLVYVALPHPLHREWAVRAADAGKHVLCEKPMAVTEAAAQQIVDAASRNDVFLTEAFAYRCHPQTRTLVDLLQTGEIGEVRFVDAAFGYDAGPNPTNYLLDPDLAGGATFDVGCYPTSMALLVASATDPTISGSGRVGPTGVDLSAAATLVFEDGPLARVACSIEANLDSSVRIYGSNGRVTVPSPWLPGRIGTTAELVVERKGHAPRVIDVPFAHGVYTIEVDAVNAAVRSGVRSPAWMTWQESLANLRILQRWRETIGLR